MKKIISDSLCVHMVMFFLLVHFMVIWHAVGVLHPIVFVAAGSIYVLNIINAAINIADFEMSEMGKLVKRIESSKYREIHVNWRDNP